MIPPTKRIHHWMVKSVKFPWNRNQTIYRFNKSKTMSHYDYSYIHSSTGWCPQTWCERWFRFTPWILVPSITLEFSRSHISSERNRTGSPSTLKPPFTSGIFQLPQVWAFELPANAAWRRLIKNVTPKKQRLEIWEWLGNDKGMIRE